MFNEPRAYIKFETVPTWLLTEAKNYDFSAKWFTKGFINTFQSKWPTRSEILKSKLEKEDKKSDQMRKLIKWEMQS